MQCVGPVIAAHVSDAGASRQLMCGLSELDRARAHHRAAQAVHEPCLLRRRRQPDEQQAETAMDVKWDWDKISKIRARLDLRNKQLYLLHAERTGVGEARERQVVGRKGGHARHPPP